MHKKKCKPRVKKVIYKKLCGYCIQYKICKSPTGFNMIACDDFKMVDIFHCDKNGQRIYVEVCIARRDNRNCSRKCVQGKLISEIQKIPIGESQKEKRQKEVHKRWGN